MELREHINGKIIFMLLYVLAFVIYIVIGLQPAQAHYYEIIGSLQIPEIGVNSDVAKLHIDHHQLNTPDEIVGSFSRNQNKTFLIGHSTTVFQNLDKIQVGDEIFYNGKVYVVDDTETLAKEDVDMDGLLESEDKDTIVIMTCAGELLGEGDATHRFIVTASIQ